MLLACWLEFKFNNMSIILCCFFLQPKDIPLVGGCTQPDIESPPLYDKPMIVQFLCLYSTPKLGLYIYTDYNECGLCW
jgi:hypothetical protein